MIFLKKNIYVLQKVFLIKNPEKLISQLQENLEVLLKDVLIKVVKMLLLIMKLLKNLEIIAWSNVY